MNYTKLFIFSLLSGIVLAFSSCSKIYDTPNGCVVNFIIAVEHHDAALSWEMLGPDAQAFYNSLGEKMRKSGKGALENEIKNIKLFKNVKKDYSVKKDYDTPELIKIVVHGLTDYPVMTIKDGEGYKIKDGNSVRNILKGIAGEYENKNMY